VNRHFKAVIDWSRDLQKALYFLLDETEPLGKHNYQDCIINPLLHSLSSGDDWKAATAQHRPKSRRLTPLHSSILDADIVPPAKAEGTYWLVHATPDAACWQPRVRKEWCAGKLRLTLVFHFCGTHVAGAGGAASESWHSGASWERMYLCKWPHSVA